MSENPVDIGRQRPHVGNGEPIGTIGFVLMIDHRLDLRGNRQRALPPPIDQPTKSAFGKPHRLAPLSLGLGGKQIGEPLGLGQIDPAIGKGTPRELSRLGRSESVEPLKTSQDCRNHRAPAMQMELGHIFARYRARARQPEDQRTIEQALIVGIAQSGDPCHPRRGEGTRERGERYAGLRPADPHDCDSRRRLPTRQGKDRVVRRSAGVAIRSAHDTGSQDHDFDVPVIWSNICRHAFMPISLIGAQLLNIVSSMSGVTPSVSA